MPTPGRRVPLAVGVAGARELYPSTHPQERGPVLRGRTKRGRLCVGQVVRHDALVAILSSPEVVEVVSARLDTVAEPDFGDLQGEPAPLQPLGEHGDVAPVGVDVHLGGVEVAQADRAHASSQKACATPRSTRSSRRSSIAV